MSASRHAKLQSIFSEARGLTPDERATFLDEACAAEPDLRPEVDALLAADAEADGAFDAAAGGADVLAAALINEGEIAPPSARHPERIGNYRVLHVLAEGGMGIVYEAEQDDPRRRVALKVVRPSLVTAELLQRFRREARLLGLLRHPGIAQIYEANTYDGGEGMQPFLAMELVDGEPIDAYAAEHRLDTNARLELIARLCDAVHYAHDKGVVHRDLKPANILVTREALTSTPPNRSALAALPQPKVLDFGVARALDVDAGAVTLQTTAGELVGTVPYMSPEQASGDPGAVDARSDVYAVGLIAYELLAGCLPYEVRGKQVHEAVRIIQEDEPSGLGTVDRSLRGDVETVVAKALEKDRERRYATAAELASDIRRHLADEPIEARPPSTLYQLTKFARRNKALVGGVLATLIVALIGAGVAIAFAIDANARSEELSQVVDFQSRQLEGIDVPAMSKGLRDDLMEEARAAWERAGVEGPQLEERAHELDQLLSGLNFIDLSLRTLDENIFVRARRTVAYQFQDQPLVEARLLNTLARTMQKLGLLDEAQASYTRALELRRRELGNDHLDTLTSVHDLGWLLAVRSEWREAEPLVREAFEGRRRVLSPDHPDTFLSQKCVAFVIYNSGPGRREEFLRMRAWQCEWLEREHGKDHPEAILFRGALLRDQGRLEEAEPFFRRHLAMMRETHSADALGLLVPLRNFSEFLMTRGQLEESEALIRESLEGTRRLLGEDHRLTVEAMALLEEALSRQGKLSDADPDLRAAEGVRAHTGEGR